MVLVVVRVDLSRVDPSGRTGAVVGAAVVGAAVVTAPAAVVVASLAEVESLGSDEGSPDEHAVGNAIRSAEAATTMRRREMR